MLKILYSYPKLKPITFSLVYVSNKNLQKLQKEPPKPHMDFGNARMVLSLSEHQLKSKLYIK